MPTATFTKATGRNNKRIGKGRLIFKNGSEYIGQFIDDQADGHGLYSDIHGNRFESLVDETRKKSGSFTNGRLYGFAEIKFKHGGNFRGEFKAGRINGHGECKYMNLESGSSAPDSGVYEGEWKRGKRQGHGIMKWRDGSEFEGFWLRDMRFNGKMKMSDGSVYQG